jgi:heat shock protein HslJ/uncharacterized membrane protein
MTSPMRRLGLFGAAAAGLLAGGCSARAAEQPVPPAPYTATVVFACADGFRFTAHFDAGAVTVDLGHREVELPGVAAASGARYEADGTLLHTRGDESILRIGRTEHRGCRGTEVEGPWERARALGVEFRALGQEPGWVVDIAPGGRIVYVGDYGGTRFAAPTPEPRVRADGTRVYDAAAPTPGLVVELREEPCVDTMSGEPFTHAVTVHFGGRTLTGCGRDVNAPALIGPRWSLIELNGAPVPADAGIELRFDPADRVSGNTGCNNLFGPYEIEGHSLRFGNLATTRRACLDAERSTRERDLVDRLRFVDAYQLHEGTLVLRAQSQAVMRFRHLPD